MKNLILILILGLTMMSCSSKTAVQEGTEISEQPDWIQSMGAYDKGQGAVGISAKSKAGTQLQIEDAVLAARNELAKNLESKIQSQITLTRQRLIEQGIQGADELVSLQTQNAVRQMVNMTLHNSRPIRQWKDPENGELYVWVVIDQKDLLAMNKNHSGRVLKKTLEEADERHDKTIKEAFNEEFEKQFSN